MPEYSLTAAPPLRGTDISLGGMRLRAPEGLAIVSIALPLGAEDAAMTAVNSAFGTDMPDIGKTAESGEGEVLMRLAPDLAFAILARDTPDAQTHVQGRLKGKAYTTDQTDVWCVLDLEGDAARTALERICPLDLHDDAFAVGAAKRTMMEHLGTIIWRRGPAEWRLMSASSSAQSFLHAIETSMKNVS